MTTATAFIKLFLSLVFLLVDVLVLMGIRRQTILSTHPIMILNAALFTTEILKIGAQVTNEYPVEIAGRVLIDCPVSDIWAVWSLVPWFSSIYLYPIIAVLHLLAIYRPVYFKMLRKKSAYMFISIVFLLSILMSLAYVIPSCGIYYSHDFLYWAFDFQRPQVFYMEKYNYVLTISAIAITIGIDVFIIILMIRWQQRKNQSKLSNALCLTSHASQTVSDFQGMRYERTTVVLTDPSGSKKNLLSTSYTSEIRLAVNFLTIFVIFVWEFLAFNVLVYFEFEYSWLVTLLTSIVSNAKVYCKYERASRPRPLLVNNGHFMHFRSNLVRCLFTSRVPSNSYRFASMDRLGNTKSPYILQHKNNPVEWYPWGAEAFEQAKTLNRPIFLSVGYSTCHWCHVMERESFENQQVADILNEHFVSIKVDREERPDVDKLYMSFIQALNGGSGGWPMSVFLTPNLAPITGGTYFPPEDRWNQMGFKSILKFISNKWKEDPEHIMSSAGEVLKAISEKTSAVQPGDPPTVEVCFMATYQKLKASFDEENGGFGDAPKFPKPVDLSFLLRFAQSQAKKRPEEAKEAIRMLTKTLHAIYHGGIHDHVGKGFHRYSVDGGWHVPHFEKMAYDQGQLLSVFSDVALLTGDEICKKAARDIVEYLEENLSQKEGGFWSAEDADSYPVRGAEHKKEGAFCVWKEEEIREVLEEEMVDSTPLSDIIIAYYGVQKEGNAPPYTDPHEELKEQNILIMHSTHEEMAEILGVEGEKLREAIEKAKSLLMAHRSLRPKPHLDSKMVTAWQGLIISGLARAAIALGDPMLARRAQVAVDFVRENLRSENGDLIRAVYTDEEGRVDKGEPIAAFSDDYAFLIQGLLDLYETTLDEKLIEWAEELQKKMDEKFWEGDSGYFVSAEDVVAGGVRMIEDQDGAEPCASSVGMSNVVRLAELVETDEMVDQAEMIVAHAAPRLARFPFILPKMLEGYGRMEHGGIKVVIVAQEASDSMPFLSLIRQYLIPNLALIRLKPSEPSWLSQRMESLEAMRSTGKPSVFICEDHTCGLPITTEEDLKTRLEELSRRSILVK